MWPVLHPIVLSFSVNPLLSIINTRLKILYETRCINNIFEYQEEYYTSLLQDLKEVSQWELFLPCVSNTVHSITWHSDSPLEVDLPTIISKISRIQKYTGSPIHIWIDDLPLDSYPGGKISKIVIDWKP